MTRKDYELIAAVKQTKANTSISEQEQNRGVRRTAAMLADFLADENPRFDAQRFLTACGFGA